MSKKKLLLHVCCGPCAIMPITRFLEEDFEVTAWFMNPNIQPLSEYLRRREACMECAEHLHVPVLFADETWDITAWLRAVRDKDVPPARCTYCCGSRVQAAFAQAQKLGFDAVSTSLLYSIYQPHETIANEGKKQAELWNIAFEYRDFRKDWQAGIDICKTWGLYRQPYCGCVYSEADRYQKKLKRLIAAS